MRATCPGARSGRISITTLPLVVSSVSVSSGFTITLSLLDKTSCSALDRCLLYVVEARKIFRQIGVAFVLDAALVGAAAARRTFAVFGIDRVNDIHAGHDAAERRKTHFVELRVVGEIDEHLARPCVRPGSREGNHA